MDEMTLRLWPWAFALGWAASMALPAMAHLMWVFTKDAGQLMRGQKGLDR